VKFAISERIAGGITQMKRSQRKRGTSKKKRVERKAIDTTTWLIR